MVPLPDAGRSLYGCRDAALTGGSGIGPRNQTELLRLGLSPIPDSPAHYGLPYPRAFACFPGFTGAGVVTTGAGAGPAFIRSFASSHCWGIVAMFWTA